MHFGCCEISLWDFMPFCPCPKHGCFKIVGGCGRWRGVMQRHACESEFGRKLGEGVGWWWGICWEGARVVSWAWGLSLPSLRATVLWSSFFRLYFLRWLCEWTLPPFLAPPLCDLVVCAAHFSYAIFERFFPAFCGPLWDILMRCNATYFLMRFSYEICVWGFLMWFDAFRTLRDSMRFFYEIYDIEIVMRCPCAILLLLAA